MRLDYYAKLPSGMDEYLEYYGWHFSKNMSEWASSKMKKKEGNIEKSITPFTRESLNSLYDKTGIKPDNAVGYDDVYIANMCKADFWGSSIRTDIDLCRWVKDVIDDVDGYDGMPFTRFYADCVGSGTPIIWEDMI